VRILLTGGTGFLGGHLAGRLAAAGHSLRALTRGRDDGGVLAGSGAELLRGTLEDAASLQAAVAGVETVIHAAGLIRARRAADYHAVNAAGTLRLLEACAAADPPPRRFVLVSSQAAQGPSPGGRPLREEEEARPVSDYGASKRAGEVAARGFSDRMEIVVLRPPAVYGPRDRETLEFFRVAGAGLRPRFPFGDLRLVMVHVEDLAAGILAAAEAPGAAGGTFALCHPEVLTFGGVLDLMAAALGRRGVAVPLPRSLLWCAAALHEGAAAVTGRVPLLSFDKARELTARAWTSDPSAAGRVLGWEARIPAAEGIPATAAWYREAGWL